MTQRTSKKDGPLRLTFDRVDRTRFDVTVGDDRDATTHRVTVLDSDLERLAPGASREELLTFAFHFLLEREPRGSILDAFDITVISRYFPEFEDAAKRNFPSNA